MILQSPPMKKVFLQAEWRKLIMVNYAIDSHVLASFLPAHTELDLWNDTCYVSLIGFMFQNTKLKGIKIPFHINFEEVNLRFYVKRLEQGNYKRGVVFVKEIVPKPALTFVANTVYGEHYETLPMRHSWQNTPDSLEVEYNWKKGNWHSVKVTADPVSQPIIAGSEEEFIMEHYWGYTQLTAKRTSEYEVVHPTWEVYPVKNFQIEVDFEKNYGERFAFLDHMTPTSVFLAEGSEVEIKMGSRLQS